jgi:hypothetical protein
MQRGGAATFPFCIPGLVRSTNTPDGGMNGRRAQFSVAHRMLNFPPTMVQIVAG